MSDLIEVHKNRDKIFKEYEERLRKLKSPDIKDIFDIAYGLGYNQANVECIERLKRMFPK